MGPPRARAPQEGAPQEENLLSTSFGQCALTHPRASRAPCRHPQGLAASGWPHTANTTGKK
eukprot:9185527-Pyramimonas_sp.AAC.1